MSDAYNNTGSTTGSESPRCYICNQFGQPITVILSNGSTIHIEPKKGKMFMLLPETNIRLQRIGDSINVLLSGESTQKYPSEKNVELALATNMLLDLAAEDLMQITLIRPVYHTDPTQTVKCGDGSS